MMNTICQLQRNPPDIVERFPFTQQAGNFNDCPFSLSPYDNINEVCVESLSRQEAGVPSSENDGKLRAKLAKQSRNVDSGADHLASQQRNSKTDGIFDFLGHNAFEIGLNRPVHNRNLESVLDQWRRQAEEAQRWPERLACVGRIKKNHFVAHGQFAPTAGSSCLASTLGLATATNPLILRLSQSSKGRA